MVLFDPYLEVEIREFIFFFQRRPSKIKSYSLTGVRIGLLRCRRIIFARGVMVIVAGIGDGVTSSNPGRD